MPTVSKSALKARMLAYFREVEETGEPLVVTSNHLPVLQVIPYRQQASADALFAEARPLARLPDDDALNAPLTDLWTDYP